MAPFQSVKNLTKNTVVASEVRLADNFVTRFFGLMGKTGLPEGHGLWITPCNQIHSCFMRFPFDAIFMDKDGNVLHCVESMKAWRLSKLVMKGKVVLELPAGTIQSAQVTEGDQLQLIHP